MLNNTQYCIVQNCRVFLNIQHLIKKRVNTTILYYVYITGLVSSIFLWTLEHHDHTTSISYLAIAYYIIQRNILYVIHIIYVVFYIYLLLFIQAYVMLMKYNIV